MIEIIEHGNYGIKTTYQNRCPFCGCIYKYSAEDVYMIYTATAIVNCPECNCENIAAVLPKNSCNPIIQSNNENVVIDQGGQIWKTNIK